MSFLVIITTVNLSLITVILVILKKILRSSIVSSLNEDCEIVCKKKSEQDYNHADKQKKNNDDLVKKWKAIQENDFQHIDPLDEMNIQNFPD